MVKAYLKIDTELGKERDVRKTLRKIKGVKSADLITGRHDILALVEGTSYEKIAAKVLEKIRKVKGIKRTVTDLVFDEQTPEENPDEQILGEMPEIAK
ncbi:MAG: AsnC family transcriptional regulator [Candidatus Altiarchaeales archaeon HGW-Altiarchaeales-2]|nr:MAG: AsnC family transcriptional regulator [Candidatus Altiarchaeales archaeon HGW-Altiarchaeales-2]